MLRKNLHHISHPPSPLPTEFLQEMCNDECVLCFNFFSSLNVFLLSGKYGTHQALSSWKVHMLAHFPFPNFCLYLSKFLSNFARPPYRPTGYLYFEYQYPEEYDIIMDVYFNLQISATHGSNDDIVREQKIRSIKLILTVYFNLSVRSFSTGRTSAVGFLKFTMSCVVINILSQKW